jgi:hypothetical protein
MRALAYLSNIIRQSPQSAYVLSITAFSNVVSEGNNQENYPLPQNAEAEFLCELCCSQYLEHVALAARMTDD